MQLVNEKNRRNGGDYQRLLVRFFIYRKSFSFSICDVLVSANALRMHINQNLSNIVNDFFNGRCEISIPGTPRLGTQIYIFFFSVSVESISVIFFPV